MKVNESLRQGKHTSKKFFILEIICVIIIILAMFIMSGRIEEEKPNATDLTHNGAIGTEIVTPVLYFEEMTGTVVRRTGGREGTDVLTGRSDDGSWTRFV